MELKEIIQENSNLNEMKMLECLAKNENIYFKSQQRGEDDLSLSEKILIASELLGKSKILFLMRFGRFLESHHLDFFENCVAKSEEGEELKCILGDLRKFHGKKDSKIVKNRRYQKLKLLIEENVYFSEIEMMKRNPLLYEQLIGQYLSEEEKNERNKIKGESFVGILLEGIERDQAYEKCRKQKKEEGVFVGEEKESDDEMEKIESDDEINDLIKQKDIDDEMKEEMDVQMKREQIIEDYIETKEKSEEFEKKSKKIGEQGKKNEECEKIKKMFEIEKRNYKIKKRIELNQNKISKKKVKKSLQGLTLENDASSNWFEKPKTSTQWGEMNDRKIEESFAIPGISGRNFEEPLAIQQQEFNRKKVLPQKTYILADERELLRNEFTTLMYQSFLNGQDEDFDYSSVDYNDAYDNINILNYDEEEKYFDSEEPEDVKMEEDHVEAEESSEDELDIYMNALNQHPSVIQLSNKMNNL